MGIEIERKWILKRLPNLEYDKVYSIIQYYNGYRYRMEQEMFKTPEFVRLKKVKISAGVNDEQGITPITSEEYYHNRVKTIDRHEIIKKRHTYFDSEMKFEIDVFTNDIHLIIMEVELPTLDYPLIIPDVIEKEILLEVTGNSKFDNYNLAS